MQPSYIRFDLIKKHLLISFTCFRYYKQQHTTTLEQTTKCIFIIHKCILNRALSRHALNHFPRPEQLMVVACLVTKRISQDDEARLSLLLQKLSREWSLLTSVTWDSVGGAFADAIYGGI